MSLTPNYSFIIPTGSDAVNLLTQCYPNFTSLDSILKPIQESGVTVATDTKVGTVHQLVRTDSSCNMFRFIATGNYASGDTFTVDGASVTATAMDGTSLPAGAFVINQSVVCILNNLVLTVLIAGKTSSIAASDVTYDNTVSGLTATNAQDAIDELHESDHIAYDNTVSGLTATDVQNAIDELASSSPGAEHGLFELWANPAPTTAFATQTVVLNSFNSSKFDAIEVEWATLASEVYGVDVNRYEKSALVGGVLSSTKISMSLSTGTGKLAESIRNLIFTLDVPNQTLSIEFGSGQVATLNTYGSAPTTTSNDAILIPVRILGLIHNS
ncbi:MAG: hypothetical protein J6Q39_00420 [Bacteroidales bacterium]|nr:hypothetical protein [Bacteroidales bacterium]